MNVKPLKIGELIAKIPVIQGGMGVGVSLSNLAGTVAKEGGIGIISTAQIGFKTPGFDKNPIETNLKEIKTQIDKAREIAEGGIVGVNIMVASLQYSEYVKAAVAAGADLIISGAGLPVDLPKWTMGTSTKAVPIVSSAKSAEVICKYWLKKYNFLPDMVVIEGPKAGGHLGFTHEDLMNLDTLDYDSEIVKIIDCVNSYGSRLQKEIPVVVAGGIYTREDMEHYLSMGASGVQMATRFVTTFECDAPLDYKETYIHAKKEDIVIVKSPVGMPGRAIHNSFIEKTKEGKVPHGKCHSCVSTCSPGETPYCITQALVNAVTGNTENALLFCGTNAYRAQKLETVHDIMQEFS